jgi:hypothetical protein
MTKEPKRPWLAVLLAFFFGGPGFFYLGLRRGLAATLAWLVATLIVLNIPFHPLASIDPEAVGLLLLQAATAWLAFRSCKRINAEAAKRAESPELDPIQRAEVKCVKEIRDVGMSVIALSGFTLCVSLSLFANTSPPIGELGHFQHDSTFLLVPMSLWGVATGIGLMRAWRWARISMLVFGGLLATSCTLLIVGFLLMPGGDMAWWSVLALRALFVLLSLVPAAIGMRWFRFFLRSNVKSYFGISRKAPATPA